MLFFNQLAHGRRYLLIEEYAAQSATRLHLEKQSTVPAIEAADNLGRFRCRCWLPKVFFQSLSQLGVALRAFFSGHRFNCRAEGALVTMRSGTHEVQDEIGTGHGATHFMFRSVYRPPLFALRR